MIVNFIICNENCNGIIISLITGLVVALLVFFSQCMIKKINNCRKYNKYTGKYLGYEKYDTSHKVKMIFELKRKGNKFIIVNGKVPDNKENPDIEGEIVMDNTINNYGRGYYRHINAPGFGFYEAQLDSNKNEIKIYVNGSFIYIKNQEIKRGWIWIKEKKRKK